jgi:hypothetical protein
MRRRQLHVMIPNSLYAMLLVETDRTGDNLAAVVRRCIRTTLMEVTARPEYTAYYDRLSKDAPEEE